MRIAFIGKMGSGKTQASKYVVDKYGATRGSFATPVKAIGDLKSYPPDELKVKLGYWAEAVLPDPVYADTNVVTPQIGDYARGIGWSYRQKLVLAWLRDIQVSSTPRERYQRIGTDSGRAANPEIWINYFRRFLPQGNITVDDLRFENEARALRDLGFVIVSIETNDLRRKERLIARDGGYNEQAQTHASETELADIKADHILFNNEDMLTFFRKISRVIEEERSQLKEC